MPRNVMSTLFLTTFHPRGNITKEGLDPLQFTVKGIGDREMRLMFLTV